MHKKSGLMCEKARIMCEKARIMHKKSVRVREKARTHMLKEQGLYVKKDRTIVGDDSPVLFFYSISFI